MNTNDRTEIEPHKSLQILDELSQNGSLTQRDLSGRLGIALGLVNSYIRNLVKKGYLTVKSIPPRRYAYYLTPKGFAEKTRLAYDLLSDYTRIYREAKNNYRQLFHELEQAGLRRVVFAGSDEVAEIAYITLQETGLELIGIVDTEYVKKKFFGKTVLPLSALLDLHYDSIVLTSYMGRKTLNKEIRSYGVEKSKIKIIFPYES